MNGYRRDARPPHSVRFRNDTWHDIQDRAHAERLTANPFIEQAAEARCGYARCYRCGHPVPVTLGDTTGMTFSEAIVAALDAAARQKCRAHEPLTISAGGAVADGDLTAEVADLRTKVEEIRERMAPSTTPSPVPFKAPAVTR